uniref:Uncharacterized protein n=1 Tax=Cacopsylla melanoneura TaxID=428564 RepID=A0A8D8TSB0_9HEMI
MIDELYHIAIYFNTWNGERNETTSSRATDEHGFSFLGVNDETVTFSPVNELLNLSVDSGNHLVKVSYRRREVDLEIVGIEMKLATVKTTRDIIDEQTEEEGAKHRSLRDTRKN